MAKHLFSTKYSKTNDQQLCICKIEIEFLIFYMLTVYYCYKAIQKNMYNILNYFIPIDSIYPIEDCIGFTYILIYTYIY